MTQDEINLRDYVVKKAIAWLIAADDFTLSHGSMKALHLSQMANKELRHAVLDLLEFRTKQRSKK